MKIKLHVICLTFSLLLGATARASNDSNSQLAYLTEGESRIPAYISEYDLKNPDDYFKDHDELKSLLESCTNETPENIQLRIIGLLAPKAVELTCRENKSDRPKDFFRAHVQILRINNNAAGIICYEEIENKKLGCKTGCISEVFAIKQYEQQITAALIDHAIQVMNKEDIEIIFFCSGGSMPNDLLGKVLEEKNFHLYRVRKFEFREGSIQGKTTQRSIFYLRIPDSLNKQLHEEMEAALKEIDAPYIVHFTGDTIKQIRKIKGLVVLNLYSFLCPPCKNMSSVFKELAYEHQGKITFAQFNIDDNDEIINQIFSPYHLTYSLVCGFPEFIFINNGHEVGTVDGLISKEQFIEKIQTCMQRYY